MSARFLFSILAVSLLMSGCASGTVQSPGSMATGPRNVNKFDTSVYVDLPAEPGLHTTAFKGTAASLYPILGEVYDELGIPIETIQTSTFLVGNESYRAGSRVAGDPISRIVSCGASIAGIGAESSVITLSVTTQLRPVGADSVLLATSLAGTAQTLKGVNSNPIPCTTRGALEVRIAEEFQKRIPTT